ncbi:MAG: DegT/DnrJ/EryC1/StrS family aminotransferase [Deltaproteobacteria bacterium]|nr:DegT/DnrJ/EryC1/StrS family aminotransferase [Deltaproteobacteria bacterium]
MIPMVDLRRQYLDMKEEIDGAVSDVMTSTHFILGPHVSALEEEIARCHSLPHGIGVANGTDALLLALRALEIGPGDEVITTPFTFFATAEVIAEAGATPVFVDIRPDTYNIDPQRIEAAVTPRTKAIIPVHLFGHPADMDPIMEIASECGLAVIEDCAQAFGAEYKGKKVGTFGVCGCFSFFPSKNLSCCGDGGMVITPRDDIAGTIRILRNHGSTARNYHSMLGYNSRLDELQAAILRVKLARIDEFNRARREKAALYRAGITRKDVTLPFEADECTHVYHQFTIRTAARDRVAEALGRHDIASAVYYPLPLHMQEVFRDLPSGMPCPVSEACAREVLSLPIFPELREDEIRRICDVINEVP